MIKEAVCIVTDKSEENYQPFKKVAFWKVTLITSVIDRFL